VNYDIRLASLPDVDAIEVVMRRSLEVLGRTTYDAAQVASAVRHTGRVDRQMIEDGTYFVAVQQDARIVGCGGWSRRAKLFRGSADQEAGRAAATSRSCD
jgi:hypothetical protein